MPTPQQTKATADEACDVFIIGGGINGCGIARELAGRGYQVHLSEMNDLSSGTSSWSTKLIHGGLRYLEYYEFGLVAKALRERETLMMMAPHLIHPLRFVLPHVKSMRPKWMLRAGLFLYDYLGPRKRLAGSRAVNLKKDIAGTALRSDLTSAFEYSDCMVDDNRLTIINARAAAKLGAVIRPRDKVISLSKSGDGWLVETTKGTIRARLVINAGGPWADIIRADIIRADLHSHNPDATMPANQNSGSIRLVRGSHIITKRLYDHDKAYIFQNSDGRILFAIPYLNDFTLIGTTDIDHDDTPDAPQISGDEIDYICKEVSAYLKMPITPAHVLHTYSGVRPLYNDGAQDAKATTRDYILSFEDGTDNGLLNIFGGKLTTYRQLGLQVADKIAPHLVPPSDARIGTAPLPGGDMPDGDFARFHKRAMALYSSEDNARLDRLIRTYGTDIKHILGTKDAPIEQGQHFGLGLYASEVDFLITHEWAMTSDDILMRRTKLGYHADEAMRARLDSYLAENRPS